MRVVGVAGDALGRGEHGPGGRYRLPGAAATETGRGTAAGLIGDVSPERPDPASADFVDLTITFPGPLF